MGGDSSRTMSNSMYNSNNEYMYKFAFKDYTNIVYEEEYINFKVQYSAGSKESYIDTVTSSDINQHLEEGSDGSYRYEYQAQI